MSKIQHYKYLSCSNCRTNWKTSTFLKLCPWQIKVHATIVLCSYYFTFRLWENWYELWVENFLRFTRETKIGLEKPILKFRVPAGHEKFQRLREANFCLPREPEKTFHEQFISVWAHPKGKIIRTDCFFSFLRVFACIWSIKSLFLDKSNYGWPFFPGVPLKIAGR